MLSTRLSIALEEELRSMQHNETVAAKGSFIKEFAP